MYGVCVRNMFIYNFLRIMCIFVGLTDFVKYGVLTCVDETLHCRSYHYYYYCYYEQLNCSAAVCFSGVCECVCVCVCEFACVCALT